MVNHSKPRAILLGAGHAHLEVARRARLFHERGYDLLLVAPGPFWYSGLATGVLGGRYPAALDQVDVGRLIENQGGTFVEGRAAAIDAQSRSVRLDDGRVLEYDVLSLNIGSEVDTHAAPGLAQYGLPVKPVENLWRLHVDVENRLRIAENHRPLRIIVAGGGPSGCEVAANLTELASAVCGRRNALQVTIISAADRVLSSFSNSASATAARVLGQRGVCIETNAKLARVESGSCLLEDGRRLEFDVLVAATGLKPPELVRECGLPTARDGSLLVDQTLKSVADARVFGAGDCVALRDKPLARVGVYAVRMAPVLAANLLASLGGRPLRVFRPQRRFLLILNLGEGTGLATWGPFHAIGKPAFWLKDRIDRAFLKKYRRVSEG